MDYYLEYGGGLGDLFYQMFGGGSYQSLAGLAEGERVTVALVTHNPFARELFECHPKAGQIELRDCGYWPPEADAEMRARAGLPVPPPPPPPARAHDSPRFYPPNEDLRILRQLENRHFVLFSVSAGLSERNVPERLVAEMVGRVRRAGLLPVFVGRSYERDGRAEHRPTEPGVLDLIDRLTVPGVGRATEMAEGVVCCHSAVNMLAWLLRKPQLLLYPESVYRRHVERRDQWAFGVDFPECRHARFGDPSVPRAMDEFVEIMLARLCEPAREEPPGTADGGGVETVPLPPESQSITLDESVGRLTPAGEVKLLAWLAARRGGNIVELGCNKGLTTRDLALHDPGRIVYAVDYFASDSVLLAPQQPERPAPDDFCVHARELPNVVCVHAPPARVNYDALRDVRTIFIDGDHTYEGVRAETEPALDFFRRAERGGLVVWHDYYDGGPRWVGVKRYVDALGLKVRRVEGTWIALAEVPGRGAGGGGASGAGGS